jgi:hypothetical protein
MVLCVWLCSVVYYFPSCNLSNYNWIIALVASCDVSILFYCTYSPSCNCRAWWVVIDQYSCCNQYFLIVGPVWYNFMSSFTSSFTTSIAKQPTLCPTLWSASLKTHSHRVKHMVKLPKHGSLPCSWSCSWSCFLKNSSIGEAELCQTGP